MNNEKIKIALCGYYPNNMKVSLIGENKVFSIDQMSENAVRLGVNSKGVGNWYKNTSVLPYLFPISSLTKPIQLSDYNNGEPFVPIDEAIKITNSKINPKTIVMLLENGEFDVVPFGIIDLLNRWKIDYRGLIAEGLAIEVNEENNPYL